MIKKGLKAIYHYFLISRSCLFDRKYYLETYPDVRKADIDPLWHFVNLGWREGRNPSDHFITNDYKKYYLDTENKNKNPLVHYLRSGSKEIRIENKD